MHILKNIRKIPFWTDYYIQDLWMRYKLSKLNNKDADFTKEEQHQLRRMLRYWEKASPEFYSFYKISNTQNLEEYPLISKEDMRSHPEIFQTKYKAWIEHHNATTGGSTGTPFGFEISANHDPIHQEFLWKLMGFQKGDKIICINGKEISREKTEKNIYYNEMSSTQLPYGGYALSVLYLKENTVNYYLEFIKKIRPAYLRGYPSAIYRLAQYVKQFHVAFDFIIKGIQLTSETVFEYQIDFIEQIFKTKVYLEYGHNEAAVFAYTYDKSHKYRCSPLYGHVEVLNKNGQHVKIGETGEVVVTSYSNFAMPFIRYKTGDLAEYGGTKGSVVILNKVWGRAQETIYSYSKRPVLLTGWSYHYHAFLHIRKWKLIQKEYGKVIICIVKTPEYTDEDEKEIRYSYKQNAGVDIEFVYMDDIELTRSGKSIFLDQYLDE